jgi:hypothetical protein
MATVIEPVSADVQWAGPTPAEHLDDLAVLIARMSTDAPMGDLTMEPQRWDAGRVRERDVVAERNGVRSVVTAAQTPDGHLVAFTEMGFRPLHGQGDWELDLAPAQAGTTAAISAAASGP